MFKNKFDLVAKFRTLMAFIYILVGLYILFTENFMDFIQGGFRVALGVLIIGYGMARIYFAYFKKNSNQDRGSNLVLIFFILFFNASCSTNSSKAVDGTEIAPVIYVDATLEPVMKEEVFLFSAMEGKEIDVRYVPENIAKEKLLKDSTSLVIITNPLTAGELDVLKKKSYYPKSVKIAVDAIALITNKTVKDSFISVNQVRDILTGKMTKWNEISKSNKNEPIQLIFDNKESSTVRFMVDSVCKGQPLSTNVTALENNRDVIEFVSKNNNSIGLIGISWISDSTDSLHLSFHKKINVLFISHYDVATGENSYKPYQAYMYEGVYPYTRGVYVINNEPYDGLLSKFTNFLANEKGQRIILKSGLFPAYAPIRLIEVKSDL